MSRLLRLGILLLLVSCGGTGSAPENLDNACAIVDQRPRYLAAMQETERKWGVPVPVQMATIYQESKFIGNARTPRRYAFGFIPTGRQSSAYGYSQALDGTWDDYVASTGRFAARRNKMDDAADFLGWYMDQTERKLGISKWDAEKQYLAYHEGHAGYARGSHNEKAWLMRVANEVAHRADMYQLQLISCGKI
ncbi:MAG: lytic transglycosylase [Defluviimonas sp.]|uniref:transglycosylase SLT domain-containing protein n=1 Tax=Albidovulum sp. TaxID=1872424 RepID=UPI001D628706|nr:lytic transglycosylase [Paracoccaceae bacterium]MCC0063069.1 lytic transglycosylase [Defluviimonas sp.]